jgi:hypothetical protein
MKLDIRKKFLTNTDETGRFLVTSKRTGRTYAIEPILGAHTPEWGDMDPVTKKLTGKYGKKYTGAIKPTDSLITEENGFTNIRMLDPGTSPIAAVEYVDDQYPDKQ